MGITYFPRSLRFRSLLRFVRLIFRIFRRLNVSLHGPSKSPWSRWKETASFFTLFVIGAVNPRTWQSVVRSSSGVGVTEGVVLGVADGVTVTVALGVGDAVGVGLGVSIGVAVVVGVGVVGVGKSLQIGEAG